MQDLGAGGEDFKLTVSKHVMARRQGQPVVCKPRTSSTATYSNVTSSDEACLLPTSRIELASCRITQRVVMTAHSDAGSIRRLRRILHVSDFRIAAAAHYIEEKNLRNTIGQFDYQVKKIDKGSRLPFDPYILLCLKHYGATTRDGAPTISAKLVTEQEIDFHIEQLKLDLDKLAQSAKAALAKAKKQTQDLINQDSTQ